MRATRCGQLFVSTCLFFLASAAMAGQWQFPVGLSYASGARDVTGQIEDNLNAEGFFVTTDNVESLPVGLSFHPYYEFDSGLGVGAGIGPLILAFGDVDLIVVPVNFGARYTFFHQSQKSFYLRAGFSTVVLSGDYEKGANAGVMAAIGANFRISSGVKWAVEAGVDSASVELDDLTTFDTSDTEEIEPLRFSFTVLLVF